MNTPRFARGILPLSADPVTYGHLDLIKRALEFCTELVVLVCQNDAKRGSYLFSLAERTALMERAVAFCQIPNVIVRASNSLLVDEMLVHGCDAIIRGIRDARDREEEERQMRYHGLIRPSAIENVVYIEASDAWLEVSSTMVKAFVRHDIDVSAWTPSFVQVALEERLCQRFRVGMTGGIATGKTWVCRALADELRGRGYPVTTISFDQLIRELYSENSVGAQRVRDELARLCGDDVLTDDRQHVDRKLLAERLFAESTSAELRAQTQALTEPHVTRLFRTALHDVHGLVIIEWAQLAEMTMGATVHHQSVVVDMDADERRQNLSERGIDDAKMARMTRLQWPAERKAQMLAEAARGAGGGFVLQYRNTRSLPETSADHIRLLADELIRHLPASIRPSTGGAS